MEGCLWSEITGEILYINFPYTKDYVWSKTDGKLLIHHMGIDSTNQPTVTLHDLQLRSAQEILSEEGKFSKFNLSDSGDMISFIADRDTTKEEVRPHEVFLWRKGNSQAESIAHHSSTFLPNDWKISHTTTQRFSEDNSKLYFGIQPIPPQKRHHTYR